MSLSYQRSVDPTSALFPLPGLRGVISSPAPTADTMYVVCGPDGERQVYRRCVERCGFRRHDEGEDW
jgi:hypothetical protein